MVGQFSSDADCPSPPDSIKSSLFVRVPTVPGSERHDYLASSQKLQFYKFFRRDAGKFEDNSRLIEEKLIVSLLHPDIDQQFKSKCLVFLRGQQDENRGCLLEQLACSSLLLSKPAL
jgi:hypothetical protein